MKADGRFVQDVQGTHQRTAQGRHQVHPLALAAGERIHRPAQRQITQSHILDALEPIGNLFDGLSRDLLLIGGNCCSEAGRRRIRKPFQQPLHGHRQQFVDGFSADFHVQRLLPEPAAAAGVAGGSAGITAEHILVLDFVAVVLHPLEKLVQSAECVRVLVVSPVGPDDLPLLFAELGVGFENGDSQPFGILDELILEPAHFLSPPAGNGTVIDTFGLVGDHQVFAHTHDFPKTAAHRAGTQGAVEGKEVFIRLTENDAVTFEA